MRIITKCTPRAVVYRCTCTNCSSEFEFYRTEVDGFLEKGAKALIKCPVCGLRNVVATTPVAPTK